MAVINPTKLQSGRTIEEPLYTYRITMPTQDLSSLNFELGSPMYDLQQVNGRTFSVFPETRVFEWRVTKDSTLLSLKIVSPVNVIGDITFDVKIGDDFGDLASIFAAPEDKPVILSGTQVAEVTGLNLSVLNGELVSIDIESGSGALSYLSAIAYLEEV